MLPKKIKKGPSRLMRKLVVSTVKMINLIMREGGVHPVISSKPVVTGRKLLLLPYLPGAFVYAVTF